MPLSNTNNFLGYLRRDGTVGVRNFLLVLSISGLTGPTARRIGAALSGAVVIDMPYGSGHLGIDAAIQMRVLIGLASHPNVGAALVIGADRPKVQAMAAALNKIERPNTCLLLDDHDHDALTLTDAGLREGARLAREMSRLRRTKHPLSALCIGLECGRSDPSSGLVANPLLGQVCDQLIDAHATVMFGETTEWLGAEHLLAARATNPGVGQAIVAAAMRRESLAAEVGIDLTGNNPGPTNIEAGLSSIEEKALGAIAKTGGRPISGVIGYGQPPTGPGLFAMDAPAYAPESITGFVAAGAQILLFTTGVGNSYVNSLAPTIKVSANPRTTERLRHQLDYSCPEVFVGNRTLSDAAKELRGVLIDIASGTRTWGEILGEGGIAFARFGESL